MKTPCLYNGDGQEPQVGFAHGTALMKGTMPGNIVAMKGFTKIAFFIKCVKVIE